MFLTAANDIRTDLAGHRLLTAGFHSQMGYFRDDRAALWIWCSTRFNNENWTTAGRNSTSFPRAPLRQFKQFMWFERAELPSVMMNPDFNAFSVRRTGIFITTEKRIQELGDVYYAHAQSIRANDQVLGVIKDYFTTMNAQIRALEQAQQAAEPSHLDSLVAFAENAFRRPLSSAEHDDILAFYHTLREQEISHEDAIRYSVVSILMSPSFCFRANFPVDGQTASQRHPAVDGLRTGQPVELFPLVQHAGPGTPRPCESG